MVGGHEEHRMNDRALPERVAWLFGEWGRGRGGFKCSLGPNSEGSSESAQGVPGAGPLGGLWGPGAGG